MNSIERLNELQLYSLVVTGLSVALGLLRTVLVVRILTPAEFGFVGIVMSVAMVVGVVQHLGLTGATAREIAVTKDEVEASKVLVVSFGFRLLIATALALILYISSPSIAEHIYRDSRMTAGLRILSMVLVIQELPNVLKAALQGLQRFRQSFAIDLVQAASALVSVVVLSYYLRVAGFFYGLLVSAFTSLLYSLWSSRLLLYRLVIPTAAETKSILRGILSISATIYCIKILQALWDQGGVLILGLFLPQALIGQFTFAQNFGGKFTLINRAVNQINLPLFSKLYAVDENQHRWQFRDEFFKLFSVTSFVLAVSVLLAPEFVLLLGGRRYLPATSTFQLILIAYYIYSLYNFIGPSVLIAANRLEGIALIHFVSRVIGLGMIWLLVSNGSSIAGAVLGMIVSAALILVYYIWSSAKYVQIRLIGKKHLELALALMPSIIVGFVKANLFLRLPVGVISLAIGSILMARLSVFPSFAIPARLLERITRS